MYKMLTQISCFSLLAICGGKERRYHSSSDEGRVGE